MAEKRERKLIAAAGRLMAPGERVELVTLAKLGRAPVAANAASVVVSGVVMSVLGGGVGFVAFAQREVYIVLTDRQLLFFEAVRATGGPGRHLASFRRELVACTGLKSSGLGLNACVSINAEGLGQPLRLTFPPLPPRLRGQGRKLAAALPRQLAPA